MGLEMENIKNCRLVIDGVLSIAEWGEGEEGEGDQELVVEGDSQYMAIAGASILAKVEHDRWITQFCDENPECNDRYNLLKSKGYGTAKHREGIKLYGGHELHRVLYIQNWLPGSTQKVKPKKKKESSQCLIKFS
jgi:ribonuclease HII